MQSADTSNTRQQPPVAVLSCLVGHKESLKMKELETYQILNSYIECQRINFCKLMIIALNECKNLQGFDWMKVELYMPHEPVHFYSDSERFSMILYNLLSNSINFQNYRLKDSTIIIRLNCTADNSTLIIRGTNEVGIPIAKQSHLFTILHCSSEQPNGSDFWLYLCNIKMLQGTNKSMSKEGKETAVAVQIPNQFPV